jgi:anti-sigma factor RsiW
MTTAEQLSCQELVELVTDYLEGALPAAERARFEEHIGTCDGCSDYLNQMRRTVAVLGRLPRESVTSEAEAALRSAFRDWNSG